MELVSQDLLQLFIGIIPGAVAGIIDRVSLRQGLGGGLDQPVGLGVPFLELEEMEPGDHRRQLPAQQLLRLADDVHDAPVGAARHQHRLVPLQNEEVLLMGENILPGAVPGPLAQGGAGGQGPDGVRHGAKKPQLIVNGVLVGGHGEAVQVQGLVDADVLQAVSPLGVIIPEGGPVDIDLCPGVHAGEGLQTAAVVIVAVGEDGGIHPLQVHPQGCRVPGKAVVGAHVEEDMMVRRFDVEAQAVAGGQGIGTGGIFKKSGKFHGGTPFLAGR